MESKLGAPDLLVLLENCLIMVTWILIDTLTLLSLGCDAINMVLMGIMLPALFWLEPDLLAATLMCLTLMAFYTATWEEYHTGTLYLGYFSGPVEGTIILVLLCIIAGIFGGSVWHRELSLPLIGAVRYNLVIVYPTILGTILTIVTRYDVLDQKYLLSF